MRACAVIPAYRNAATVAAVVRGTLPHVEAVFVVDDGSDDGTGDAAAAAGARVLTHAFNRGKGAALGTGLRQAWSAGFTHMVTLDADGQHFPADVPTLLKAAATRPDAIVVGARPFDEVANVPGSSKFGRSFSNFWVWLETGQRVDDSQSGFRVYPVAEVLALPLRTSRYDWEVEVLVRGAWEGLPVIDAPIRVYYPPAHERVSHFRKLRDNVRISWLNTWLVATLLLHPGLLLRRFVGFRRPRSPDTGDRAWSGRSYGGRLGHRIFVWGVTALGARVSRFLTGFVIFYYCLVARRAVRASLDWQRRVFPPASAVGRALRVYRHLFHFGCQLGEKLLLLARGLAPFQVEGVAEAQRLAVDALAQGKGLITVNAHAGAWELAVSCLMNRPGDTTPVHIVMFEGEEARLAEFLDTLGDKSHRPHVISIGRDAMTSLRLLEVLRRGEILAFMGDRVFDPSGRGATRARFCGELAAFPNTPYLLSALSGAPVFPVFAFATGIRRYQAMPVQPRVFHFERRSERGVVLAQGAQWYAQELEKAVRQYPYQWYNFFPFWDQASTPRSLSYPPTPRSRRRKM